MCFPQLYSTHTQHTYAIFQMNGSWEAVNKDDGDAMTPARRECEIWRNECTTPRFASTRLVTIDPSS